ncbi:MAG: hypothetical protein QME51_11275 [Planctomycetota bacterium]|nr:hypothetical protein [Planctomycetota bacterium]
MRIILVLTFGVFIGGLIVAGGVFLILIRKYNDTISAKDSELSVLRETTAVLTKQLSENEMSLRERDKIREQLQTQIAELEKQLSDVKRTIAVTAETTRKDTKPEKKTSFNKERMHHFAKAVLKAYQTCEKEGEFNFNDDPTTQATFMELAAEMMRLMTKYNLKLNMQGPDDEFYKAYAIPEVRQWFLELGSAVLEELELPLTTAQFKAMDETMRLIAEDGKKLEDPNYSSLEKSVMLQKLRIEYNQKFASIFTDEQNKKLLFHITAPLTGSDPHTPNIDLRILSAEKSQKECGSALVRRWQREFALNESEKQNIAYISDMYISEYSIIKNSAEAEYDKEFMDYYMSRRYEKQQEYFSIAENHRKRELLNLRFAELQLKYQQQLQNLLPDKQEQIKNQKPAIYLFPYLEQ